MSEAKEQVKFGGQHGLTTLEFGAKEKVKKLSTINDDGSVQVKFAFRNGQVRTFDMAPADPLYARAAMHGLDQKLGDEFSGLADPDDCVMAFEELSARLAAGEWNATRQGDGLAGVSILAKALVKLTGKTIEQVKEGLKPLSAAQKAALRKQPAVAKVINELEEEREARKPSEKRIDADALLSQFA